MRLAEKSVACCQLKAAVAGVAVDVDTVHGFEPADLGGYGGPGVECVTRG